MPEAIGWRRLRLGSVNLVETAPFLKSPGELAFEGRVVGILGKGGFAGTAGSRRMLERPKGAEDVHRMWTTLWIRLWGSSGGLRPLKETLEISLIKFKQLSVRKRSLSHGQGRGIETHGAVETLGTGRRDTRNGPSGH